MWAQRAWVGQYLPADTASGRELLPYSRLLNAVEGNTTFYATPDAKTVASWARQTGEDFGFLLKLPRTVSSASSLSRSKDSTVLSSTCTHG